MSISSLIKNEALVIKAVVAISAVILAVMLIGFGVYGIDLSAVFLGTPWNSPLAQTRGVIAIEGVIAAATIIVGGLFVGSLIALIRKG